MAWRPYENLIDGELDNRTPGKVIGWLRFYRKNVEPLRVTFNLEGDFHDDIRGALIRLSNPHPSDCAEPLGQEGTYMGGFSPMQTGEAGDITAGISLGPWSQEIADRLMQEHEVAWDEMQLPRAEREKQRRECATRYRRHIEAGDPYYPYVAYPYIEWYSEANGRVVLELDDAQVSVVGREAPREKTPAERLAARQMREAPLAKFLAGLVQDLAKQNREKGDDGGVFGVRVS